MKFKASTKIVEDVAVLYTGSYLNQLCGELIEKQCNEFLEQGVRRLVIDLKQTELINSIGISILLGVIEAVSDADGTLVLSSLSSSNRELFGVLGLLPHLRIEADEPSAIEALTGSAQRVV